MNRLDEIRNDPALKAKLDKYVEEIYLNQQSMNELKETNKEAYASCKADLKINPKLVRSIVKYKLDSAKLSEDLDRTSSCADYLDSDDNSIPDENAAEQEGE